MEGDHERNFQKLLVNETYFDRTVQVSIGNYEGALIMLVHSLKKENKELVAKSHASHDSESYITTKAKTRV